MLVGLGACLLAAILVVGFYRHEGGSGYPLDDSWIHLAFARHLARGEGFGANPHQPTPGATSPLWVVLLAAGFLLGADYSVWPWFLAAILLGTTAFLCSRIVVETRRGGAEPPPATLDLCALLCGLTVTLLAPLVWSAAGAMEVPLFCALVAATLLAFARRDAARRRDALAWGGLAGLAALARPEGLLLAPILAVTELVHRRRNAVSDVALALTGCAVVYSPSALFCLVSSGRLFPNTFYAKTTALVSGPPDLRFWLDFVRFLRGVSPVTLLALVLGLAMLGRTLVTRRGARRGSATRGSASRTSARPLWAVAGFALGLPLAYSVMGRTFLFAGFAGNFGRYLYPMMPCALVLGFWGIEVLVAALRRRSVAALATASMLAAAAVSAASTVKHVDLYRRNVADIDSMQRAMAEALRGKVPAGTLVAANDVGALAYFTDFRVLDLIGIVSTETLDALAGHPPGSPERDQALFELLVRERPRVLVVFPEWYAGTLRRFGTAIRPIEIRADPRNITSGESRLVAFEIDWEKVAKP